MKKEYMRYGLIFIVIILFGIFVYPTLYRYDKLDQKYPVKINRLTGKSEMLTINGWVDLTDPSSDLPPSASATSTEPRRDQNGYTFEDYFDKIKENTKHPELLNKQHELFAWMRKIDGLQEYNLLPDDNGERFTIGDTQKRVKEVMGTPDGITLGGFEWHYGLSKINFTGNPSTVSEYYNIGNNLKVK